MTEEVHQLPNIRRVTLEVAFADSNLADSKAFMNQTGEMLSVHTAIECIGSSPF